VITADVRELCRRITGQPEAGYVSVVDKVAAVQAGNAATEEVESLVTKIDAALEHPLPDSGLLGKIAIAKLLVAGDVLAVRGR